MKLYSNDLVRDFILVKLSPLFLINTIKILNKKEQALKILNLLVGFDSDNVV